MRLFKTYLFTKWARKEKISDSALIQAMNEIESGLIDADLGGNVYKKRIPLRGKGKRGGARTLIAYKKEGKAFFVYGFAKNEKANLDHDETKIIKTLV